MFSPSDSDPFDASILDDTQPGGEDLEIINMPQTASSVQDGAYVCPASSEYPTGYVFTPGLSEDSRDRGIFQTSDTIMADQPGKFAGVYSTCMHCEV
jgi:hypothetical protein